MDKRFNRKIAEPILLVVSLFTDHNKKLPLILLLVAMALQDAKEDLETRQAAQGE